MLYSIVIPVYNVEKYLDECMQSILQQVNQINKDCEVLLIDDGSTDNSGFICDDYAKRYSDIVKVYHQKNQGLLSTRRYGFKMASGEYIINCDSDDLLETNALESVKKIIIKYNNPDIIFINHYEYDGEFKIIKDLNVFSNERDSAVIKDDVLRKYLSGYTIASVWGKIVRRVCINVENDYSGYERLSTGEDTLQSIEFFSNAKTFVYLNEPLYDYRCDSGMTSKFDQNYFLTFKKIFEQIEKKKADWNLKDFDRLFAIKILQTAGRAITQSRYNKWDSIKNHKSYLIQLSNDQMLKNNYKYLKIVKNDLQYDHYLLLNLLKSKQYTIIVMMLLGKNIFD
jgi:glycosyltransferase involved in cell wall biosynthesis